jgi:predicted nucleic acid-binding protein
MADPFRRIYFDTRVYIEYAERRSAIAEKIGQILSVYRQQDKRIVTSELTLGEALVHPLRNALETGDYRLRDLYRAMLQADSTITDIQPVSRDALEFAAFTRAKLDFLVGLKIKLPDAIHLATAVLSGCDTLVSNDGQLGSAVRAVAARTDFSPDGASTSLRSYVSFADGELDRLISELGPT